MCADGGDDEPAAKRRRTERTEGEKLIKEFVVHARKLKKSSLSKEEVKTRMDEMKREISANDNAYVQAVIQS